MAVSSRSFSKDRGFATVLKVVEVAVCHKSLFVEVKRVIIASYIMRMK